MRALILPGMDGSGRLLDPFVEALSPEVDAVAAAYPPGEALGYDALVERMRERLPGRGPFLLVGESFSGPIAIRIAASQPRGLAGLVLCASFASAPQPWFGPLRPILRLPVPKPPVRLLMPVMMGRWTTREWTRREREALACLPSRVARHRLSEAMRVDAREALPRIRCPLLYLQASHDRLVPRRCWREIARALPRSQCVRLEGPHFLLQHDAHGAAAAVKQWLAAFRGADACVHADLRG